MSFTDAKTLALDTVKAFMADRAERLGAAIAYYAAFSLAPLLVLTLAIVRLLYGQQSTEAREALLEQTDELFGEQGVSLLQNVLSDTAVTPGGSTWALILGSIVLLIGATALFARLQDALNTIWETEPEYTGVLGFLWSRGLSLLLVIASGALIFASLMLNTFLNGLADVLGISALALVLERVLTLAMLAVLFGLLYRILPDTDVEWADVWPGALMTAVLFSIGTWGMGWYLSTTSVTSGYGAAGAFAAFLLWIYYAAQIFFMGAEFTSEYAKYRRPSSSPEIVSVSASPEDPVDPPARSPSPWPFRLGWMAMGILIAVFFRR